MPAKPVALHASGSARLWLTTPLSVTSLCPFTYWLHTPVALHACGFKAYGFMRLWLTTPLSITSLCLLCPGFARQWLYNS
jgi:hypothetical protein